MNKYDERYEIRLARSTDIDAIMTFLDEHWKKGHILSTDRTLFEYEFADGDAVHMMLAIDKNEGTIEALTGFLPCSHTTDKSKMDVWGSFWKVNDSHPNITFLGVEIMKRLIQQLDCRTHLGIGVNPNTALPIRKATFHEKTAKMEHYYLLNPNTYDFKVAVIQNRPAPANLSEHLSCEYKEFHSVAEIRPLFDIEKLDVIPYKDFWYLNKRFFEHPYYDYHVYGLKNAQNEVRALLIGRIVSQNDRLIFRIVDYIGDQTLFADSGAMFQTFFQQNNYEYIDFYTFGFDETSILAAGFTKKDEQSKNIIPNYFGPFVQENVDIYVRYVKEGTLFCKADGDQDRPNLIP